MYCRNCIGSLLTQAISWFFTFRIIHVPHFSSSRIYYIPSLIHPRCFFLGFIRMLHTHVYLFGDIILLSALD